MHILKSILSGFLKFILANAIFLFIITFSIKGIFTEGLIKEIVKDELSTQFADSLEIDKEKTNKILENEKLNQMIQRYIDNTIEGLADENSLDNIEIGNDIAIFIKENKSELEKQFDTSISTEKIDEVINSEEYKELNEEYKRAIKQTRDEMSQYQKQLVRVYTFLTTTQFKVILLVIIIVLLVIISLLQKSFYRWLKPCAIATIVSGICTLAMAYIVSFIVNSAIESMELQFVFKVNTMYTSALIACIIGLIMLVIYFAINHYFIKKRAPKEYQKS